MSAPVLHSPDCLNCGTPLHGHFCSACGQRDIPPYPSTRELVVDAFWELSGWDGRFVTTVKTLVRKPGMLTREFLEGRRARYLSPLRLYLLASLAYFVLAAAAPNLRIGEGKTAGIQVSTTRSRPERVVEAAQSSLENGRVVLTAEEKAAAMKDIERAPALMRPFLRRAVADPAGFKRGMVEMMPRMLFALLPIFAGLVGLFYRGRKYPEHLYFAIHLHAFTFMALSVVELVKFTRLEVLTGVVAAIAVAWIVAYATLAFRRVYGGALGRTIAKELAIGALYGVVSVVAFIVTIYWVALMA